MDEYISRKAAIAYIRKQSEECQKAFEELGGESGIYADVAPVVHGRWVLVNKAYDKYKCSNCGALDYITIGQKYCIYYGAKMDGGGNTER